MDSLFHSCGRKIFFPKKRILMDSVHCPYCNRLLKLEDCTNTNMLVNSITSVKIKDKGVYNMFVNAFGKLVKK